jgi:hypothetical protein
MVSVSAARFAYGFWPKRMPMLLAASAFLIAAAGTACFWHDLGHRLPPPEELAAW